MGNQYSVSTTDQVFPVEHYFQELPAFTLGSKLGSTRFMKVAKAVHNEGLCVVKIFVIHDRSLNLELYERSLTAQKDALRLSLHCLPFSFVVRSERFAALCRTYVKDTLYDRMNARPYLLEVEKKWIAFQCLCALQECHEKSVCHGDIKTSNIVVTSWNWTYLTDFASFKPTFLPDSDPADFNYYFDTSRRRTCYISPERFMKGIIDAGDFHNSKISLPDQQQEAKMGVLHWSMDIFSLGCVFLEFFGDGDAPFDLSKLLAYRNGEFYPSELLKKIESDDLRNLIEHMIQKEPSLRLPAANYLRSLRGKGFPETFYSFLNSYLYWYSLPGIPDDRIIRLHKDLPGVIAKLSDESSSCLVLILSLLLSNWRSLNHCDAKLAALDIAETLAPLLPVDIVLDRLLPYLLTFVEDRLPIVRSNFIISFSKILQSIPSIRRNEGHIFRAYILPDIEKLVDDPDQRVRITFAMHIAQLAETSMRFLELSYLGPSSSSSQDQISGLHDEDRYPFDTERMLMLRHFQSLLEKLILKQNNSVKRALLEHGMGKLCQVFGRKLTREVILPHLVTFLNEKPDWQLRAAFFKAIVGLATFVGLEGAGVFRALLEQGLTDPEEFVVVHALRSFLDLVKLNLMPKISVTELLLFCSPLLVHPNVWIRRTAASVFVAASKKTDFVDQQTRIRPLLLNYFDQPITFIDEEESLLGALISPLNRRIYSIFTTGRAGRDLLGFLELYSDAKLRISSDKENELRSRTLEYQLYQKLHSIDIHPNDKTKIMLMKDFILKLRLPSQSMEKELALEADGQGERTRTVNKFNQTVPIRWIPDIPGFEGVDALSVPSSVSRGKKQIINDYLLRTAMSEEWNVAFGSGRTAMPLTVENLRPSSPGITSGDVQPLSGRGSSQDVRDANLPAGSGTKHVRIPSCEVEIQRFIQKRLQERSVELSNEVSLTDLEPPLMYGDLLREWKPSGILVAHLHEHHSSVVRLRSNKTNGDILSCSLDGTVKLWDCARMEGRGLSNRARYTYKNLGSPVRAMTYCEEWKSFACAGENGSLQVVRMEADPLKNFLKLDKAIDPKIDGIITEIGHCDPGAQHILTFITSMGAIAGWDLRAPNFVWKLQSDLRCGMLKTFCVSPEQNWITTGSLDGYMVTWDLRFRIAISTLRHPTGAAIHRLYTHPKTDSAVIACAQGNNEVSVWDTETRQRTMAIWSGPASPLAGTQTCRNTIRGLQVLSSDARHMSLITSGTDRRTRYWDTFAPDQSYMISAAAGESLLDKKLLCRNVQVDGVEVLYEHHFAVRSMSTSASISSSWMKDAEINSRGLLEAPSTAHTDAVNDLVTCSTGNQLFLVTGSRDGIIKVWK